MCWFQLISGDTINVQDIVCITHRIDKNSVALSRAYSANYLICCSFILQLISMGHMKNKRRNQAKEAALQREERLRRLEEMDLENMVCVFLDDFTMFLFHSFF